ncbi:transketolase [candidate division GN15 bacterium]|nr:transketolase [candidate division GN15 bacterium]
MFDAWRGFKEPTLPDEWREKLTETAKLARGDILKMTTISGSGHPGGSMSSIEMYLTLYHLANVDPKDPKRDDRDRIIISHGHTSPGAYTALAYAGFFDRLPMVHGFRQGGSPFEGHVEQSVPGIEWDTGNLGQGLSVGIGKAIYARLSKQDFHTYVLMGDGEQQKGQISEARRHAVRFGLHDITAFVDCNGLQISGKTSDIQHQNLKAVWSAEGWHVMEIDGHDLDQIYDAIHQARHKIDAPVVIIADTVMGKGVSFMENTEAYHGAAIKPEQLSDALRELDAGNNDYDEMMTRRRQGPPPPFQVTRPEYPEVVAGEPKTYGADDKLDNRGAWGNALLSLAEANMNRDDFVMAVFDCDLAGSVKTAAFGKKYPDNFFQCGITEHGTAVAAGSLSAERAVSIWADFGVFGIVETYNQARLNDINHTNLKLFVTHSGVNVGEDGKTHQCIDYFSLLNSTFGWKVITPADPNQTDRIARYVLTRPGNFAVVMGRAKIPTVLDESGKPFFGEGYEYRYGRMETVRSGEKLALVSAGNMLPYAVEAWQQLADDGIRVALVSVSDWCDLHPDDLAMLGEYDDIVTLEDHNVKTGLGTAIAAAMFEAGHTARLNKLGVYEYASSGKPMELYQLLGLDPESVARKVKAVLESQSVRV